MNARAEAKAFGESTSGGEEGFCRSVQSGESRAATRGLRIGSREHACDFAELGARGSDDGRSLVEALGGFSWRERETRLLGAAHGTQSLASAGERIAFAMHQALDFEGHLHIASAIEALTSAAFAGLELREL
jgi:hypothetical protein